MSKLKLSTKDDSLRENFKQWQKVFRAKIPKRLFLGKRAIGDALARCSGDDKKQRKLSLHGLFGDAANRCQSV